MLSAKSYLVAADQLDLPEVNGLAAAGFEVADRRQRRLSERVASPCLLGSTVALMPPPTSVGLKV